MLKTRFLRAVIFSLCSVFLFASAERAYARPDVADLFVEALLGRDLPELNTVLSSNFIFIGSNGHIQDKDHFLDSLQTGRLIVKEVRLKNTRESTAGSVRMITGNGVFTAYSADPLPSGLMRVTLIADRKGSEEERIVLVQLTPVVSTKDCADGNCRIR
ncbi:MAG: nuclear transport factor 2 family protein [Desulfovibrionaceae bacterium]|nr:nuclear transport factor 2 family protein [Desulfovibrionaceae bacterium]